MRNRLAKRLRRIAEENSVGQSVRYTKRLYRALKKEEVRSKAITGIATQIVKSAQVSLSALKMMHAGDLESDAAKIIGIGEAKSYELKDRA